MIIQCDFDGTIIRNNLSVLIREQFAPDTWREIETDYLEGRITVEESNKKQFALIKEPKQQIQEFIQNNIDIRKGFSEFVAECKVKNNHLVIVSSGLDFYIEVVLDKLGLSDIELYCGETKFSESGIVVSYTDLDFQPINKGFKLNKLLWLQRLDNTVIYIGDGLSDFDAACNASYVFATGHLAELLTNESVSWNYFDDFTGIIEKMPSPEI